ncbi:serine hydrolase domain-containing protein [Sphingomonas cavernae]|uniref:Class A beta-lactamase-related serine hydrolase n=1 Tax=Sphingomonas cavernae TaxID=2320861 RepID=A0A418WJL3_9SPHN|nr:serine hydrolase domain-containing protein [Sphingomonas cavernae]RJF90237.1 class A beta-lactamase-related serine hydrolase [Sphingomonas cavernae]
MTASLISRPNVGEDAVQRLNNLANYHVDVLKNVGVSIGIDLPGSERIYVTAGHADRHGTTPVKKDHLFQIGSQSKTAVAMTLLLLERSGAVSLDDAVLDHVDLPIDRRITIRHLLMNASGLGEFTSAFVQRQLDPHITYAPRDLVAMALPQGQIFEPGDRFDYSNTGWVVAALAIEAVTGERYGDVIRRLILDPLQLKNTWFGGGAPTDRMMRGYIQSPVKSEPIDSSECLSWAYGAGDGVSNVDDMLDLFGALIKPDSNIGINLSDLTRQTAKHCDKPYFSLSFGTEYGLGVERRAWAGQEVWGHPGSTFSYVTSTWIDAAAKVVVTTCVTRNVSIDETDTALRYPREQLFAMTLNTAYAVAQQQHD